VDSQDQGGDAASSYGQTGKLAFISEVKSKLNQ